MLAAYGDPILHAGRTGDPGQRQGVAAYPDRRGIDDRSTTLRLEQVSLEDRDLFVE